MQIKIIKSSNPYFWYSNHIGEIFEIDDEQIRYSGYSYLVNREDLKSDIEYFIDKGDCEILE